LFEPADPDLQQTAGPVPGWEYELFGFPVSCHPLDYFAPGVDWSAYVPAAEVNRHMDREIEVCGLIVCDRLHPTDRGVMKFMTLADHTGFVEVSLFADAYRTYGHHTIHPVVAIRAVAEPFDNRRGVVLNAGRVFAPKRSRQAAVAVSGQGQSPRG